MTRPNHKKTSILLTIVVLLITIGIVIFIIIPSIQKISYLKKEITTQQTTLERQYEKTKRLKRSLAELEQVEADVDKFKNITAQKGSELELIKMFETLAEIHDITQTLTINATEEEYTFTFVNKGTFENHLAYFKAMEMLDLYVFIDKLTWTKSDNKENLQEIVTSFNGKIYAR